MAASARAHTACSHMAIPLACVHDHADVLLTNPPFWTLHPTFCNHVHIHDVRIETQGPNTDGIDPDSCQNVLIERCHISTGDDCIAIKSGKDADGRAVGIPTANVLVSATRCSAADTAGMRGGAVSGPAMHTCG